MSNNSPKEGLKAARLLMVLSSISPLFILVAIRGISIIPDLYLLIFCGIMVLLPDFFLCMRIKTAIKNEEKRELSIGAAEDNRDHILVYLFAMLLPFYTDDLNTWRELTAAIVALSFIVFLFWHLNMHYMNILFAIKGYRVFTVYAPIDKNVHTGKASFIVITKRVNMFPDQKLIAYRLSDTVYLEV